MTLAHAWVLHLLWLLPLIALALMVENRKKTRAIEQFADPELLSRLTEKTLPGRRFVKGTLILGSLALILLGLAGPRWGSHFQEVAQKGVDIMILVDVSTSMLVKDVKPNRLERAKREIMDFLRVVQGDRIGLAAFSGAAFIQCPLTLDYAALEMFLGALQPDLIPVAGTDLGAAIETGLAHFDPKTETDKVILLITDGEDNEGQGLKAAREAVKKGVKVFVFGIGNTSGGPIPAQDGGGGFKKDKDGKLVLSKLNEQGLSEIASLSGGTYVRSVAGDLDLDTLYFDGIKSKTDAQTLRTGKIRVYDEHFAIFLLIAFLLLFLEGLIAEKKRQEKRDNLKRFFLFRSHPCLVAFLFVPFLLLVSGVKALAAQTADELYRQGRFSEAEKAYARSDMDSPKDVRFRYNRGCAAYQSADYQGAQAAFSSVLKRAQDKEVRFKAVYNLGNAAFQQGDFGAAAARHRESLILKPSSEDAAHNLELSLRALEKQRKEKNENPERQTGQHSNQEKKDQNKPDHGQDKAAHNKLSDGKSTDEEDSSDQTEKDNPPSDEKKEGGANHEDQSDIGQGSRQDSSQGRSGQLKSLGNLPEKEGGGENTRAAATVMDQKKAEAMLDNMNEDRSRFMRHQLPEDKRHGGASGKDW